MQRKYILIITFLIIWVGLCAIDRATLQDFYNKTYDYIQNNPESPSLAKSFFNLAETGIILNPNDYGNNSLYYEKVLELDPYFPDKDVVLYNIGYNRFMNVLTQRDEERLDFLERTSAYSYPEELLLSEDKLASSISAFEEIIQKYNNSPYYQVSLLFLGRIHLNIALDTAAEES
ncbi:MAG: hypothetical protein PHR06_04810, partial [Candidatus Cloacimonetes bacterium]|nr:hypothetical protein [Candidatus Cloacimonadota bacterium]